MKTRLFLLALCISALSFGQRSNKFRQMDEIWPTPGPYRNAAGAPGYAYYQNRANYEIDVTLDEPGHKITGSEKITYINNSPDALTYLWLQLDQNVRELGTDTKKVGQESISPKMTFDQLNNMMKAFDGGYHIEDVKGSNGKDLPYFIVKTMMRVDLPSPLKPGASVDLNIKYWFNIQERAAFGGRMGYEYFEEDSNYIYTMSMFFPRMCVYNDVYGWQNKQFLGRGEFTLPFGDYKVKLTVPADHIVGATGELQNASSVLTSTERKRFEQAKNSDTPVLIVTEEEARIKEKTIAKDTRTWIFHAENVRDFAFASSRKFIWDAQGVKFGNRTVMAMSYYPKEGNPLWGKYSTKVVAHTIRTYSKHTFDYPYPVAISVHTNNIGMEYPMICFNGGRPEKDGTYSERTKYGMITVIIHEVGHNFFPMIINSDERQWTWMDEGLNSFLQYLTEQAWDENYPSRRGPAYKIVDYMADDPNQIMPIMTNSESLLQFGNNAYGKPATALNILRETILGRENFDYAFKTYAQRWMFKHPEPTDLFRTMEDASGVDLDWFWRGWFYSTDYCDIGLKEVKWYKINTQNPDKEVEIDAKERNKDREVFQGDILNREDTVYKTVVERDPATHDFYTDPDRFKVTELDRKEYQSLLGKLSPEEKSLLNSNLNFYELKFEMIGQLVMPVIIEFEFSDGQKEKIYIPAEIWRFGDSIVSKVFWFEKEVVRISLDPNLETADVNRNNNYWPPRMEPTRFELFQQKKHEGGENPMQRKKRAESLNK
ncbi:MAG: M1 family peptidase [Bacteroidetes bacterium]|nr:M1 family peptidase [Bacteroidota bacterium]